MFLFTELMYYCLVVAKKKVPLYQFNQLLLNGAAKRTIYKGFSAIAFFSSAINRYLMHEAFPSLKKYAVIIDTCCVERRCCHFYNKKIQQITFENYSITKSTMTFYLFYFHLFEENEISNGLHRGVIQGGEGQLHPQDSDCPLRVRVTISRFFPRNYTLTHLVVALKFSWSSS